MRITERAQWFSSLFLLCRVLEGQLTTRRSRLYYGGGVANDGVDGGCSGGGCSGIGGGEF